MPIVVNKPWGQEFILTDTSSPHTAKIFKVKANCRWSLQYHDQKSETLILISGQAKLITNDQQIEMVPLEGYNIPPMTKHRLIAITDCVIVEASDQEKGTTYRLEDDYNRTDETPETRNLPNRGWNPN